MFQLFEMKFVSQIHLFSVARDHFYFIKVLRPQKVKYYVALYAPTPWDENKTALVYCFLERFCQLHFFALYLLMFTFSSLMNKSYCSVFMIL